jgi:hypothetical protein
MNTNLFKKSGASIAALALGLSLTATPGLATAAEFHGGGGGHGGGVHAGGGGFHGGGGGFHGGGGGFHGGNHGAGGEFHGGNGGYHGGGWNGGHGNGYGYAVPAIGLGLLGGAIVGSQYYNGYGAYYDDTPQAAPQYGMQDPVAYCESHFRSYDPSSGTYLGYDGLRHSCP